MTRSAAVPALQLQRASPPEHPNGALTPELISRIAARGRRRSVARGDVLVEVGDRVVPSFLVASGELRAVRTFDGTQKVSISLGAGEFWSGGILLSGRQSMERLRVNEPGLLLFGSPSPLSIVSPWNCPRTPSLKFVSSLPLMTIWADALSVEIRNAATMRVAVWLVRWSMPWKRAMHAPAPRDRELAGI